MHDHAANLWFPMAPVLPDIAKVEAAIFEITNTVRAEARLGAVVISPQLTAAARAYAGLLAKSGQFSHEADGTLTDRTGRARYNHCMIAENLAAHQDSRGFESRALAKSALEGWLNSPGHRKNLMTPEMTEIGVAVAKTPDKDPKYIAVQLFGRPQSMAIEFQVSNASTEALSYSFGGTPHDLPPHMAVTLTSCKGGALNFEKTGAKPFSARYEAAGGKSYVVTNGAPGTSGPLLRIEVKDRQTVK